MVLPLIPLLLIAVGTAGILSIGTSRWVETRRDTALIKAEKMDVVTTDYPFGFSETSFDIDAIQGSSDPKVGTLIETPNFAIQSGETVPSPVSTQPKMGGGIGTGDAFTNLGNTFTGIGAGLSSLFSGNTIKIFIFIFIVIIILGKVKK